MNLALRYKATTPAVSAKVTDDLIAWMRDYFRQRVNSRWIDERRCIPPYIVLDLGNQGLFGFNIETEHGGLGLRAQDWGRVMAQSAALDPTISALIFINSLTTRTFTSYGSPEMKAELLPSFAKGRILGAYAQTEPCAGSNFTAIETRATKNAKGGWSLSGDKVWIGNGGWAAVFAMFAHTELGLTAFRVPAAAPGLNVGLELNTLGLRGVVQNEIHLKEVAVRESDLIGALGDGISVGVDAMTFTRLTISSHQVGCMKRCVQLMYRYACRRTISTGKLVANAVAMNFISECIARAVAAEALVNQLLKKLDAGDTVSLEMCALCKIVATEFLAVVADKALQLLGGRGFEENNVIPQIVRDARVTRIFEGPTEVLAAFVGARIKGLRGPKSVLELSTNPNAEVRLADGFARIKQAAEARQHASGLSAEQVGQWAGYRAGMFAAVAVLAEIYQKVPKPIPAIQNWLATCGDAAVQGFSVPGDCFLSSSEIQEVVATFETEIGVVEQESVPGLNWNMDPMLRI